MRIRLTQNEIVTAIIGLLKARGLSGELTPAQLKIDFTQKRAAGHAGLTAEFDIPELDANSGSPLAVDPAKVPSSVDAVQGEAASGELTSAQAARVFREAGGANAGDPAEATVSLETALEASGAAPLSEPELPGEEPLPDPKDDDAVQIDSTVDHERVTDAEEPKDDGLAQETGPVADTDEKAPSEVAQEEPSTSEQPQVGTEAEAEPETKKSLFG